MRARGIALVVLTASILGWPASGFAQLRAPKIFGDVSVLSDFDATDYASGVTTAGGFSAGVQLSSGSSIRFEREVPGWHASAYVAPQVRTITNAVLYGRHFEAAPRVNLAVLVGGTATERMYSTLPRTHGWFAATVGGDAEIAITPHVAVVPGIRYHKYLSYESFGGSMTRPRIGVRVRF